MESLALLTLLAGLKIKKNYPSSFSTPYYNVIMKPHENIYLDDEIFLEAYIYKSESDSLHQQ